MDKNEAINIIRSNFPNCKTMLCEALETLIPELKESEDERIRKELIIFLEYCQDTRLIGNEKRDKWILWLEKQSKPSDVSIKKKAYQIARESSNFIPTEQPNEYLEYLATSLEETIGTSPHSREIIISHLQQAAQWQKEQMMKSTVDATCVILPPPDLFKILICHEVTDKLTDKQKIKILIVKEDE